MYICIFVYICIHIHIYTYIITCTYHTHANTHTHTHTHTHSHTHILSYYNIYCVVHDNFFFSLLSYIYILIMYILVLPRVSKLTEKLLTAQYTQQHAGLICICFFVFRILPRAINLTGKLVNARIGTHPCVSLPPSPPSSSHIDASSSSASQTVSPTD